MNIGVFITPSSIDGFTDDVRRAADDGMRSVWTPQIFSYDALTAIATAGRAVPDIAFGTAVIPTYPRHPIMLAAQALTTQEAVGGRLTLGIGLSHQVVIEGMFGYSFDKPARHMREYLSALMPLLRERSVGFQGETLKAMAQMQLPAIDPPPVVVAALGERMLRTTGQLADGTVTWMTGPKTVGDHIAPRIVAAASEAGRDAPRVVVALPVSVTDEPDTARERAAGIFSIYGQLPSYRAMLDREGAEGPADVVIAGDEAQVAEAVRGVFDAGATEFVAVPFHDQERTMAVMRDLVGA